MPEISIFFYLCIMVANYRHRAMAVWCVVLACATMVASCNVIEEDLPSYTETSLVDVGDRAPGFEVESLDGEMLRIPNGETTLLILFSHTCPDCRDMMCDLQEHLNSSDREYNIMAISRGGSNEDILAFRDEHKLQFPIAADSAKQIYYAYATMYVPRCYIVDSDGIIRYQTYEYATGDIALLINKYEELER